jgi:hypothetical protein
MLIVILSPDQTFWSPSQGAQVCHQTAMWRPSALLHYPRLDGARRLLSGQPVAVSLFDLPSAAQTRLHCHALQVLPKPAALYHVLHHSASPSADAPPCRGRCKLVSLRSAGDCVGDVVVGVSVGACIGGCVDGGSVGDCPGDYGAGDSVGDCVGDYFSDCNVGI